MRGESLRDVGNRRPHNGHDEVGLVAPGVGPFPPPRRRDHHKNAGHREDRPGHRRQVFFVGLQHFNVERENRLNHQHGHLGQKDHAQRQTDGPRVKCVTIIAQQDGPGLRLAGVNRLILNRFHNQNARHDTQRRDDEERGAVAQRIGQRTSDHRSDHGSAGGGRLQNPQRVARFFLRRGGGDQREGRRNEAANGALQQAKKEQHLHVG